ncbi:phosphoribosylamine--glycine ligase [Terracoccus luteus]|uniref:Phosphoribosylamine--glycine ligase n=1 Tax=Terracoccus luteus TaxID=53356 RepID=A0A839PZ32_9MICO|nr:phosphoribosylamine--glycine ligase [Terracoccus luteus]MBB2988403.1 phosphoribosylamine--glycine ligase [Terracoccus luteus]MCP2174070.1 phosphoribosylamine--glycine ligase [Terracoccus luteus]
MKALVLGSGAREHALVKALAVDPEVDAVIAAPGNPGIDTTALCVAVDILDGDAVAALAREHEVDLVVVGPEAPLVAGVADVCRAAGLAVFGPSAASARLEGSKAFAKDVMAAADVPTARAHVCTTLDEVEAALDALGAPGMPYVVKDDGLAAGKGVVVTESRDEALSHAASCLAKPDGRLVVEEYLDGPEVSVFCLSDGETVVALEPAQDFKRVGDDDAGPNTGGMGAYSPLEWAPSGLADEVVARVAQPTVDEMRRRGTPFVGVLYVGLALTSRGLRVIEFNVRFGDPDGQASLARLESPFGQLLLATATGGLGEFGRLRWSDDRAVVVVVASSGYPAGPRTGDPITGLDAAAEVPGVVVLHAGTARSGSGALVSAGGRVLDVVAVGSSLKKARASAYEAVGLIELDGSHHRSDIALRAQRGELVVAGGAR